MLMFKREDVALVTPFDVFSCSRASNSGLKISAVFTFAGGKNNLFCLKWLFERQGMLTSMVMAKKPIQVGNPFTWKFDS